MTQPILSSLVRRIILLLALFALPALAAPAIINTVVGSGDRGFGGDGANALDPGVMLSWPAGVAFDSAGNIYIADSDNHRIRKVTVATGLISTIVGGGVTSATLNSPGALAVDGADNLYIADVYNHRILKLDTSGNISTVAGTGYAGNSGDGGPATAASLSNPAGVAVDGAGNLYILSGSIALRKVDTSGTISTVASVFAAATGLAVDAAGNAYVTDYYGPNFSGAQIFKVAAGTAAITSVACGGNGGDGGAATAASLYQVRGVAIDSRGNVYFINSQSIRKIDGNGIISTVAGDTYTQSFSGDGGAATAARFSNPLALAVDQDDNLYIADQGNQRIRRIVSPPTTPSVTATPGDEQATLSFTTPAPRPATLNPYAVVLSDLDNGGGATLNVAATDGATATDGTHTATVAVSGGTTRIVVSGLANGTLYSFTVEASNSVGSNGPSNSQEVKPGVPVAPSVSAADGTAQVSLDFATPADNGSPLSDYEVVLTPSGGGAVTVNVGVYDGNTATSGGYTATVSVSGANTRIVVSNLVNGLTYSLSVAAWNSIGLGDASASLSATPAAIPPTPNVTASSGNQQVQLDFATPANLGIARGYTLVVTPSGGSAVTLNVGDANAATATAGGYTATVTVGMSGASTRIVVGGLTNNTAYAFTVAARNSVGSSSPSTSQSATPAGPPDAPAPTVAAGNAQATLSFSTPADNGAALSSYTLDLAPSGGSTTTLNFAASNGATATVGPFAATLDIVGGTTRIVVTGLANGTAYVFTVTVANSGGSASSATTNPVTPGAATTITGATSGGSGSASVTGGAWVFNTPASAGFIAASGNAQSPPSLPPGYSFPQGLFDFTLAGGAAGTTATVVLTFPAPLPANTVYWKYGPTPGNAAPHWYVYPNAVIAGNTVTLTLTDGLLGDDDLVANGTIVDVGGPGAPGGVADIPTLSEWGMIILAALMALCGLTWLRRQDGYPAA